MDNRQILIEDKRSQIQSNKTATKLSATTRTDIIKFKKLLDEYSTLEARMKKMSLSTIKTQIKFYDLIIDRINYVDKRIPTTMNGWYLNKFRASTEIAESLHDMSKLLCEIVCKYRGSSITKKMMLSLCIPHMKVYEKKIRLCRKIA